MKRVGIIVLVVIVVIFFGVFKWGVSVNNRMVEKQEAVSSQW